MYYKVSIGFAIALMGGFLFSAMGIPLPWILGAMTASSIFSSTFGAVRKTKLLRRAGQLLVGASAGAVLTPETLTTLAGFLPSMIGAALAAVAVAYLLSFLMTKLSGVDRITSILATLPAGLSTMGPLALELGARVEVVTIAHTIRVVTVVTAMPIYLGLHGHVGAPTAPAAGATYATLVLCLALATLGSLIAVRAGFMAPWVIMPMIVAVGLALVERPMQIVPHSLLVVAQAAIGFSIGVRFDLRQMLKLPREVATSFLCSTLTVVIMVLMVAPLLASLTGVDLPSMGMAVAPGGLGEMIATANALAASTAVVGGFQFMRSLLTNALSPALISRLGR